MYETIYSNKKIENFSEIIFLSNICVHKFEILLVKFM